MAGAGSSRPVAADAADLRKGKGCQDRPAQSSECTMVSSEKPEKKKLCKGLEYHCSNKQIKHIIVTTDIRYDGL